MKASAPVSPPPSAPGPAYCTRGDTLCQLRFWTEAEWDALGPDRRPAGAAHKPGSGWVAAVPVRGFS